MCVFFTTTTILLIEFSVGLKVRYENYSVHSFLPANSKHLRLLQSLQNTEDYQFWSQIKGVGLAVDVMVPPHKIVDFQNFASSNAIPTTVLIENVQEKLERVRRSSNNKMHWHDYHTGEEVNHHKSSQQNPAIDF